MSDGWSNSERDALFRDYAVGVEGSAYAGERPRERGPCPSPIKFPNDLKKVWDGLGFWDPNGVWGAIRTPLPLGTRGAAPGDGDLWIAGPIRGARCGFLDDAHLASLRATDAAVRPAAVPDARGTLTPAAVTPFAVPADPQATRRPRLPTGEAHPI